MDRLAQDLRYAIRKLSAAPTFTLAAVATLAIGIGATTAIFSTVNATLLRPLPFTHPEELIALRTRYPDGRVTTGLVAAAEIARIVQSPGSVTQAGLAGVFRVIAAADGFRRTVVSATPDSIGNSLRIGHEAVPDAANCLSGAAAWLDRLSRTLDRKSARPIREMPTSSPADVLRCDHRRSTRR